MAFSEQKLSKRKIKRARRRLNREMNALLEPFGLDTTIINSKTKMKELYEKNQKAFATFGKMLALQSDPASVIEKNQKYRDVLLEVDDIRTNTFPERRESAWKEKSFVITSWDPKDIDLALDLYTEVGKSIPLRIFDPDTKTSSTINTDEFHGKLKKVKEEIGANKCKIALKLDGTIKVGCLNKAGQTKSFEIKTMKQFLPTLPPSFCKCDPEITTTRCGVGHNQLREMDEKYHPNFSPLIESLLYPKPDKVPKNMVDFLTPSDVLPGRPKIMSLSDWKRELALLQEIPDLTLLLKLECNENLELPDSGCAWSEDAGYAICADPEEHKEVWYMKDGPAPTSSEIREIRKRALDRARENIEAAGREFNLQEFDKAFAELPEIERKFEILDYGILERMLQKEEELLFQSSFKKAWLEFNEKNPTLSPERRAAKKEEFEKEYRAFAERTAKIKIGDGEFSTKNLRALLNNLKISRDSREPANYTIATPHLKDKEKGKNHPYVHLYVLNNSTKKLGILSPVQPEKKIQIIEPPLNPVETLPKKAGRSKKRVRTAQTTIEGEIIPPGLVEPFNLKALADEMEQEISPEAIKHWVKIAQTYDLKMPDIEEIVEGSVGLNYPLDSYYEYAEGSVDIDELVEKIIDDDEVALKIESLVKNHPAMPSIDELVGRVENDEDINAIISEYFLDEW